MIMKPPHAGFPKRKGKFGTFAHTRELIKFRIIEVARMWITGDPHGEIGLISESDFVPNPHREKRGLKTGIGVRHDKGLSGLATGRG